MSIVAVAAGAAHQGVSSSASVLPQLSSTCFTSRRHSISFLECCKNSRNISAHAIWSRRKQQQPEDPVEISENKQQDGASTNNAAPAVEEEVELSWVQEKTEELVQITQNAVRLVPGPKVGQTSVPWLVAAPVAYLGITFLVAVYRTIKKYQSPKSTKKRLIGKNAYLVTAIDDYFPERRLELDQQKFKQLQKKCGFDAKEVLRKYIRYAFNERKFGPDVVADLIHLRKLTRLDDESVSEVLNDVSQRIVKDKGTVMMDLEGLTMKGVKRKAAVQSLFSKLLYLSELDEFCSTSKATLRIKEIFGVTDEDANSLRIETLSELSDIDSLEKMVEDGKAEKTNGDQTPPTQSA